MTDKDTPSTPSPLTQRLDIDFALEAAGLGVWELDPLTNQVRWDERCRQIFGVTSDMSYEQAISYIHPDDVAHIEEAVRRAMNAESGGHYDVTYRTISPLDNQTRWVRFTGRGYFTPQGQVYRFAGVAQDVTQTVLARQQAEDEAQIRRLLVEEATVATALYVGQDCQITFVNDIMLGYWGRDRSIVGQPFRQALPELESQGFPDLMDQVFQTGVAYQSPDAEAYLLVDGQLKQGFYNFTYKPLFDRQGQVWGVHHMALDVTQQIMARRQVQESEVRYRDLATALEQRVVDRTQALLLTNQDLKRSNDNLQQFAYIASHDLQEPLRKIQSFGNILLEQTATALPDEHRFMLGRMVDAGSRMSTLVSDLLAYSRIATRQEAFGAVSLQAVIANVLDTLDLVIEQAGASVQVGSLPPVNGDKVQLTQLFQNLVSNALKFARVGQPPVIHITHADVNRQELPAGVRPNSPALRFHQLKVIDNGIGFDQKYLDRIFQVFQRLHGKGPYPGTGIGLAICQRVVDNHGGAITATSQPGQGATFEVYLPV